MTDAHPSAPATLRATRAALEVIHDLEAAHGPLMFFQTAGCCEGLFGLHFVPHLR